MAENEQFADYELIRVSLEESYAASVRANDRVLVAAGHPVLTAELVRRGLHPLVLDMSEYQRWTAD